MSMDLTGIVLAGGRSTRMQTDKAALKRGGSTLLDIVAGQLQRFCSRIIVVCGDNGCRRKDCLVVNDIFPDCGPLGGIYTGLYYSKTPYNMVAACDMPFFKGELARFLFERAAEYQVVVPQDGVYYEPLSALYHESCKPVFLNMLENGSKKITDSYDKLRVNKVPVEEIAKAGMGGLFLNINTPHDWESYCRLLEENNETHQNHV